VRETTIICNRCRGVVVEDASVVKVEAGPLRRRLGDPLDLCSDCCDSFSSWLAGGRCEALDGLRAAEPARHASPAP